MRTGPHERFVGLMSGTSCDGVDAVVVELSGHGCGLRAKLMAHSHQAFPADLRRRVLDAALHGTVGELCELNVLLGEYFGRAALRVIRRAGLRPRQIRAIGSHGQTLHHLPRARTPSTLQLGEPAVIAERTGITTVADFRVRDMAAGGQGAPLVPYADWVLFTDARRPRIIQNLGGIANLTFVPPGADLSCVRAFDTGPGNMIIDAVVSALTAGRLNFDRNGEGAREGTICQELLDELMRHPFIARRPPKTTGREEFGEPFVQCVMKAAKERRLGEADLLATVTAFTAESVAQAYRRFIFPRLKAAQRERLQIVLGGGGAKNRTLRRMLRERVGLGEMLTHEDFGIPSQAKEALAFAVLAHATLHGRPANVPGATGACRPVLLGKIIPA